MIARERLVKFITRNVDLYLNNPDEFIKMACMAREAVEHELSDEDNELISNMSVSIYNAIKGR